MLSKLVAYNDNSSFKKLMLKNKLECTCPSFSTEATTAGSSSCSLESNDSPMNCLSSDNPCIKKWKEVHISMYIKTHKQQCNYDYYLSTTVLHNWIVRIACILYSAKIYLFLWQQISQSFNSHFTHLSLRMMKTQNQCCIWVWNDL